jgi:dimethylglycine catabolism A
VWNDHEASRRSIDVAAAVAALPGLDYVSVSAGDFSSMWGTASNLPDSSFPPALWAEHGRAIKDRSPIPVFLVGRILTPRIAEKLLRSGACDLVAMARELVADPELPTKAATGRRIRPCVGIQSGCWQRVNVGHGIQCAFNPVAGREVEDRTARTAAPQLQRPLRITVVGGGPGGLAAAHEAARAGHHVTVFESREYLGGAVATAARAPHRADLAAAIKYLRHECDDLAVTFLAGTACERS